jgi:hypothetical protein
VRCEGAGGGWWNSGASDGFFKSSWLLRQGEFHHDSAATGPVRDHAPQYVPRFSLAKNWHFGERLRAQFRAEFFNIFNHPNFANPYGGQNGFGFNDPSVQPFGCGCATPDVAAANPVIGSGGSRAVQLGLKFMF